MFELLIDDMRDVEGVDLTVRTSEEGLRALRDNDVTHLYLDNDLGEDQPMEGIDILNWARDNNLVPPNVFIISANPVAKRRMEAVLINDLGYNRVGNWWKKPTKS